MVFKLRHFGYSFKYYCRFADDMGMPLFETSAKDDSKADHVDAIFMTLAHKVKDSKPMMTKNDLSQAHSSPTRRIANGNESYTEQSGFCCWHEMLILIVFCDKVLISKLSFIELLWLVSFWFDFLQMNIWLLYVFIFLPLFCLQIYISLLI